MDMKIDFVTSNKHKVKLANKIFAQYSIEAKMVNFDFLEVQKVDGEEVAFHKAQQLLNSTKKPFIIEDTSFHVEALKGFPGALFKYIFQFLGYKYIFKMMDKVSNRHAFFKGVIVYGNPKTKEVKSFVGVVKGTLSESRRGNNKRGTIANEIFIPKGFKKTLAELNKKEWSIFLNQIEKENHYAKFAKWFKNTRRSNRL